MRWRGFGDVYGDSWKGDDIFNQFDRLRPVVTQPFADMLAGLRVNDVFTIPAEWVER